METIEVTSRSLRLEVNIDNIIYAGYVKAIAPNYKAVWCIRCIGCDVIEVDYELDWSLWETLNWERLELADEHFVYCNPKHLVWRELDPDINGFSRVRFSDASYLVVSDVSVKSISKHRVHS